MVNFTYVTQYAPEKGGATNRVLIFCQQYWALSLDLRAQPCSSPSCNPPSLTIPTPLGSLYCLYSSPRNSPIAHSHLPPDFWLKCHLIWTEQHTQPSSLSPYSALIFPEHFLLTSYINCLIVCASTHTPNFKFCENKPVLACTCIFTCAYIYHIMFYINTVCIYIDSSLDPLDLQGNNLAVLPNQGHFATKCKFLEVVTGFLQNNVKTKLSLTKSKVIPDKHEECACNPTPLCPPQALNCLQKVINTDLTQNRYLRHQDEIRCWKQVSKGRREAAGLPTSPPDHWHRALLGKI